MQHLLWPALGFAVALIAVLALRWAVMTVFNRWATGPGALAAFLQAIRLPSLLWCGVMAFYVTIEVASEADVLPRRLTGELTTILQASIILSVTITLAGMVETLITRVGESRAFGVPRDRPGARSEPADHSRRRFSRPALGARDPHRAHPDGARRRRARRRARAAEYAVEPVRRHAPAGRPPDSRGRLREDRRLRGGLRRRCRLALDAGEDAARQRGRRPEQARGRIDHHQLRPAAVAPRAWDPRERRLRVEAVLVDEATRAAPDVPGLLDDPRPIARLIPGFGESSLDFTLVCQVASFVDQYPVQHELRKRILRRLWAERIGMPFPTRTVELRGAGGGSGHARALADRGEHGERDQHEAG